MLLLTRPLEQSQQTQQALNKVGIKTHIFPVLEIKPLPLSKNLSHYPFLILTSANALRFLDIKTLPPNPKVLCVGSQTALFAKQFGFSNIESVNGTVQDLVQTLIQKHTPEEGPFLYLTGQHHTLELEDVASHLPITTLPVYEAQKCETFDSKTCQLLTDQTINSVALYSKRSAAAFIQALKNAKLIRNNLKVYCLSKAIAEICTREGFLNVFVSKQPNQTSLLNLITTEEAHESRPEKRAP